MSQSLKVIIAGSRSFADREYLYSTCDGILAPYNRSIIIISGGARGADSLGEDYAIDRRHSLIRMPARWKEHGRSAGHIRNEKMARAADMLIAFWDGESKGTQDMIRRASVHGLDVRVERMEKPDA